MKYYVVSYEYGYGEGLSSPVAVFTEDELHRMEDAFPGIVDDEAQRKSGWDGYVYNLVEGYES